MKLNNCQNRDRSNHPTSQEMQESLGGSENEEAGLPLGGRKKKGSEKKNSVVGAAEKSN